MTMRAAAAAAMLGAALLHPSAGATPTGGAAPGRPGEGAVWTPADKHGFGTARGTASPLWYTLQGGRLSEVYYPDLGTPSVRELDFVVADGTSFAELAADAATTRTRQTDARSLSYEQVSTERAGRWRLTKRYTTDPGRAALLVDVRFESLTGAAYRLYARYDPSLHNNGMDDSGRTVGPGGDPALLAYDGHTASALLSRPAFTATSTGYLGRSDGWVDLRSDRTMDWRYRRAAAGNIVQTGATPLTGRHGSQHLTLTLGFGSNARAALDTAHASRSAGFARLATSYADGWHRYLDTTRRPASARHPLLARTYATSVMVLAASEDKRHRGAFVASPSMPWIWGAVTLEDPSGPYHLVWSRDLYEIATGLLAAGDRAAAERALHFLFSRQQEADGSFPQNSEVDGRPHWTGEQLDETADPILLAWQLGRRDAATWSHVRRAADFLLGYVEPESGLAAPYTAQERWENQSGYGPAAIGTQVAALVCAADIASANGAPRVARRYLATADHWRARLDHWTVTTNGPLSARPYYLRLTKDGHPNRGTTYDVGDSGPAAIDQRRVVDPSFLEVVRLGVESATHPAVLSTLPVVDRVLAARTPSGTFWHRYTGDGYGEQRDGGQWVLHRPGEPLTFGRVWPIFAGERGEYELAAGRHADARLLAMARAGDDGYLISEQVWDGRPPTGAVSAPAGEQTRSASPLAWSHAQFIRLAVSIDAGRPVEQPAVVACRYLLRSCR